MKFTMFLLALFSMSSVFGQQNQSDGSVLNSITPLAPNIPTEIFRFQPGAVTQLDTPGSGFTFGPNSRWFTLGRVPVGSQKFYGLRLQVNGKALIFGYNKLVNKNPRIQWIGDPGQNTLGNLQFRVADDFMSTNSRLVATMRKDGSTIFGPAATPYQLDQVGVGILSREKSSLKIYKKICNTSVSYAGLFVAEVSVSNNFGVASKTTSGEDRNFAIFGAVGSSGSENYAIYGRALGGGSNFAGFFDGNVVVTGNFTNISDRRLKKNIKPEKNVLEKIEQLKPVTYQFKETEKVNLPGGLQHGFVAQDLEKTFPELVKEVTKPVFNDKGQITGDATYKTVNYIGMISILTQSVKELQSEVDRLKEELDKPRETYVVLNSALSEQERKNLQGKAYVLEQNVPNPYSDNTVISYKMPKNVASASIMVFDMTGRLIKKYQLDNTKGRITLSASDFGQGIYLYSLVSNGQEIITKRMIIE